MQQHLVPIIWCLPPEQFNQQPYEKQFEAAATSILQTIYEEDRNRYSALTAALELRFADEHLRQVFAAQVKTLIQKVGESLK